MKLPTIIYHPDPEKEQELNETQQQAKRKLNEAVIALLDARTLLENQNEGQKKFNYHTNPELIFSVDNIYRLYYEINKIIYPNGNLR